MCISQEEMKMEKNLICIKCPMGCKLSIENINGSFVVKGNVCNKGKEYGIKEITNPTRT